MSAVPNAAPVYETARAAAHLASRGLRIFPIAVGMKGQPLIKGWPELATSDPAQVAQWWPEGSQNNIGVVGGKGHVLFDIDTRKPGCIEALAALEAKYGPLPKTFTVATPSGGEHRYFRGPDVPNSAGRIGPGLDIKGVNGYVVGPWSFTTAIEGKQRAGFYVVKDDSPIADAPAWLIELTGVAKAPNNTTQPSAFRLRALGDAERADLVSALDYLATRPEIGGNKLWSEVGYALKPLGDEGREIWCEWSGRAPGYGGPVTPEDWWDTHGEGYSDYRHVFTVAQGLGWVNPRSNAAKATAETTYGVPPPPNTGVLVRADAIAPEPILWLWKGYLARGKLNLLAGHGGTGKSIVTLRIAATVTRGGFWPDNSQVGEAANVLIWSSEDDAADTIIPRLMAVGADLKRVHIIAGAKNPDGSGKAFDPSTDMPQLRAEIERIGGAALLIIDPIVSAVSGDMHRANDVRRELQCVVDLAAAHDCAVIGISHFTKGSSKTVPTERVLGSVAFTALARIVLVCAQDEAGEMRVFMRSKSNLGPVCDGFMYAIEAVSLTTPGGVIEPIKATWGEPVTGTARELLAMLEPEEDTQEGGEFADCKAALCQILTGPTGEPIEVAKRDVEAKLAEAGHTRDKLIRKARAALRVTFRREGFPSVTLWRLPTSKHAIHKAEPFGPVPRPPGDNDAEAILRMLDAQESRP